MQRKYQITYHFPQVFPTQVENALLETKQSPGKQETPFLSQNEAAHFLKMEPGTLKNYRYLGKGPNYRKHGRAPVYHVDDLITWSNSRQDSLEG